MVGFEEALRQDMESVLSDKRDFLALNGQAAVTDTSPVISGIISDLTNPTNPSDIMAYTDVLGAYDDHVDGKLAVSSDDVRMLVNADTYKKALSLVVGTAGNGGLLRDRLAFARTPSQRFRVSSNMPATASTIATAITYASQSGALGYFMPIWAGIELLADPYTMAKAGRRLLTAVLYIGAKLVDGAAYKRLEFKVA